MNFTKSKLWILMAIFAASLSSCTKDEDPTTTDEDPIENGQVTAETLALNTPDGLEVSNISITSATIEWNSIDSASFYNVEFSISDDFNEAVSEQVDESSINLQNLEASKLYYVRIQAGNNNTLSEKSDFVSFTTLEDPNKPIQFTNSKLEEIIRMRIGKTEGDLIESDLLAVDSLIETSGLESLIEVELLANLKYLFIFENGYISEDAIDELKANLSECTIINSKYIEQNDIYYELDTLYVETTFLDSESIYQHEIIMKGANSAYVEIDIFSEFATLTETIQNVSMFANSTSMTHGTFHDRFSGFSIEGVECPDNMKDYMLYISLSESTLDDNPVNYLSVTVMSADQSPRIGYMTARTFE